MRLDLDIDPASLPTAQQKGVTKDGRVYTKAKVARAKLRLTEAIRAAVSISRFARDNSGLSKVVAWTHAKRVVAAFREGMYTI